MDEQPRGPAYIDGGAALSIACALLGVLSFVTAVWIASTEDAAATIAWDRLISVAPDGGEVAFALALVGMLVLGMGGVVFGLLARRRICAHGTALRGRKLAVLGIGAGVALIALFALSVADIVTAPPPVPGCACMDRPGGAPGSHLATRGAG